MEQTQLFELQRVNQTYRHVFKLRRPIWTENKAKMIEFYLRLFVYITKHGAYIDGFAGPQWPKMPEVWTAKLVLESEPKRLQQFFLCDLNPKKVARARSARGGSPRTRPRDRGLQKRLQRSGARHPGRGLDKGKDRNILPAGSAHV
jgi:hypothetical protein